MIHKKISGNLKQIPRSSLTTNEYLQDTTNNVEDKASQNLISSIPLKAIRTTITNKLETLFSTLLVIDVINNLKKYTHVSPTFDKVIKFAPTPWSPTNRSPRLAKRWPRTTKEIRRYNYRSIIGIFSSSDEDPVPRFYLIGSRVYQPILSLIALLSPLANNYVPRGETRWVGEIDQRDRSRLETAVSLEGTGIYRKDTNSRIEQCVHDQTRISDPIYRSRSNRSWEQALPADRNDNFPRPRRSTRGKSMKYSVDWKVCPRHQVERTVRTLVDVVCEYTMCVERNILKFH